MLAALLPSIIGVLGKAIDKAIGDKDEAERLKQQLSLAILSMQHSELQGAVDVIKAEAQGDSWIQRSWRPILMLVIVAIVANNHLVYPYLSLYWREAPELELPDELWELMKIGVGGYVLGRSGEKAVKHWKGEK